MLASKKQTRKIKPVAIGTAEAFYLVFCALPKKARLAVAQYILKDADIQRSFNMLEIPNKTTLKAFAEDKSTMPLFHSIDKLRKDLLS
jgi:hypothetical protein